MVHPRVLEWNSRILEDVQKAEELALLREMDDEEAIKAYFDDVDMI